MNAYFIYAGDPYEGGFAYVLPDRKAALKMRSYVQGEFGCDFIDIRVKEIKGANVEGLPEGEVRYNIDACRRGIVGSQELFDNCEECNEEAELSEMDDGKFVCSACEDGGEKK